MFQLTAPLMSDAYKTYHPFAYKPGVSYAYENFTNRSNKLSNIPEALQIGGVVHLGLQYVIKEFLIDRWSATFFCVEKKKAVAKYSRMVNSILGKKVPVKHIEALWDVGYLPIEIKALPEGTIVPYGVPPFTIKNTIAGFHWVPGLLETLISAEIWPMSTSATTAFAYRKAFEKTPIAKEMIPFMGHDFSYRGMFGSMAAAMSGFGHLCSFVGSDTYPAAEFAEYFYNADVEKELVMASVDATEHSVMCSYGTDGELESLRHLMTNVTPTGILSVVSDTWDFWKLVGEYLPALKDEIMAREGTLVIRPDSGDPVEILCGLGDWVEVTSSCFRSREYFDNVSEEESRDFSKFFNEWRNVDYVKYNGHFYKVIRDGFNGLVHLSRETYLEVEVKGLIESLWDIFGGTEVEWEGGVYKLLDSHIGAIYGDSITLERQRQIHCKLMRKGFVPSVVLGIGSFTYQYVTRDTHGSAMKATSIVVDGERQAIAKDPKTDRKKKSAKGLIYVGRNEKGEIYMEDEVSEAREAEGLLQPVFRDGKLLRETSLKEIRAILENQL